LNLHHLSNYDELLDRVVRPAYWVVFPVGKKVSKRLVERVRFAIDGISERRTKKICTESLPDFSLEKFMTYENPAFNLPGFFHAILLVQIFVTVGGPPTATHPD
jgi:hypothetical protein